MTLLIEQLAMAYRQMHIIRKFEETIRRLFQDGKIRGSFHPCVGQEATAVGACLALRAEDQLSCTYRGHGHAIAKGLSVRAAMAEMLGKATGCSKGKGGSMHFTDASVGLLGANAIVAAGIPHAAGAALAAQMQKKDFIAIAFFGEGAVNQGVFHETLNLAAVWKLPLVLVCENNRYSEMTPSHETTSTVETWRRAASYGISAEAVDGNDVEAMYAAVSAAASRARSGGGASYLEAKTYRLWGHMMGDPEVYRSKEEVAQAWQAEPIARLGQRLNALGCTAADLAGWEAEADGVIADALAFAEASPAPLPAEAFTDIFTPGWMEN
ncbi:MAG: thiamine pyrophosphate-dependent dehydrogenase E1 component subunit alpha [Anaerolineaceae bacterium]|nr:thiamine pyrophosphate-dependent dehydrogenase E1 component subunit alpha [Anaerolineaceae bacterium]